MSHANIPSSGADAFQGITHASPAEGADGAEAVAGAAPASEARPTTAPDLGEPHKIERLLAGTISDLFSNSGLLRSHKVEDFRSEAAAAAAVEKPLVSGGEDKPLGPVSVFRPGLANTPASPALLFRAAQYTDKLVVAYPNAEPGQDLTPRPVDEIGGVPVPPELQGKIFVSGDPSPRMIPWEKASELFERQLNALDESAVLGGGSVEGANLTVIGHSQGGLDAAHTRRRLEAEGRADVIGKVITLNSPFKGSPLSDEKTFGLLARGLDLKIDGHAPQALQDLGPRYVSQQFGARDQRHVDLSVASSVDGSGADNVRPLMNGLAKLNRFNLFNVARGVNDGFVNVDSMRFGQDHLALARAHDHAGIAEDPAVIDDIIGRLVNG